MLFTTPTQYIALAIALVAGWLFGLASHPGGKKWKARYAAERDAHAAATKRIAELERDNARLAKERAAIEERRVAEERAVVQERPVVEERIVHDDRPLARPAAEPAYRDDRTVI
ncbi:hypothetical protein [uncultured Sphingomonas sp.]|uniref:hypothetical protein n=1 Tax=uncultured Sphingomonas sp. TaxID=158754 RepID=UPI0025882680|nr:hypothetical protein [uncultured Sphingomonas sp.]